MTMIDRTMEPFVLLEKERTTDGAGGYQTVWRDGLTFFASVSSVTTALTTSAESVGASGTLTLTTDKALKLEFPDVVRRESTGRTYRITTRSEDRQTPPVSDLSYAQVDAEEWRVPDDSGSGTS